MRRTIKLWTEMIGLSWRRVPGLTVLAILSLVVRVAGVAGGAFALRAAVDEATRGVADAAVLAAIGAAIAYALLIVVQEITDSLTLTIADRVGRLDVHPRIHRDLAGLEGLEHLERTEFLDRITLVRKAGGRLAGGAWNGLKTIAGILNLVIVLLLLGSISPWLLLLLPFAAVPIWCDSRGNAAVQRADLATAEQYRLQQHLFELGTGTAPGKELRVSGAGRALVELQHEAWRTAMGVRLRATVRSGAWSLVGWTVFVAAFVGGILLSVRQTANGHGTAGDLVLLVTVAVTLRASIQSTVESTTTAAGARQYIAPYLWLRDYADQARSERAGQAVPPAVLSEGIVLDHVTYTYPGTHAKAVDDVSVTLPAGSVVAIVGEYGSGKTTLVKLLEKFYRPDSGQILVDSVPLSDVDTEQWRTRSTAAFQDFGRFHTTVRENVGLGDLAALADEDRVRRALAEADAADLVEQLPDGLDTLLGRQLGGLDLSEGQWQRTALARASMRTDPLLLILDEPTASLDAPSEQAIFERYMARARQLAERTKAITVIVSHRFSTVTGADLILVLDRGRLTELGTHAELLRMGGTYAELYRIQATAYQVG
ncbi:MAG: ABC transporter ATP-binding protein [Hamadaea sp.]|uniref:ABC transporter ATP-binding protein n=1 Tax=Hamadaea sp. TaxID=2024425 RepID=UPI00182DFCE8|nr:ABC transporter ATP-binding protein [Hamadaea sp.]NUT22965.1 ABC transporter ATP-binding protein [Hamadaea sp.]